LTRLPVLKRARPHSREGPTRNRRAGWLLPRRTASREFRGLALASFGSARHGTLQVESHGEQPKLQHSGSPWVTESPADTASTTMHVQYNCTEKTSPQALEIKIRMRAPVGKSEQEQRFTVM
jgi:hypothetical protein